MSLQFHKFIKYQFSSILTFPLGFRYGKFIS